MKTLRALLGVIAKMFAADLWLTIVALLTVALCAAGLNMHRLGAGALPFVLAGGVIAALAVGVARGARR